MQLPKEKKSATPNVIFESADFFVQLLQAFLVKNVQTFQRSAGVVTFASFQATNHGSVCSPVTLVTKKMEKLVLAVSEP